MFLSYILWWLAVGSISTIYFYLKDGGMLEKIVGRLCVLYGVPNKKGLLKLGITIFFILFGSYVMWFNEIKIRLGRAVKRCGRKIRENKYKKNYIKTHSNLSKAEAEINVAFIFLRVSCIRKIRCENRLKEFEDWLDGE